MQQRSRHTQKLFRRFHSERLRPRHHMHPIVFRIIYTSYTSFWESYTSLPSDESNFLSLSVRPTRAQHYSTYAQHYITYVFVDSTSRFICVWNLKASADQIRSDEKTNVVALATPSENRTNCADKNVDPTIIFSIGTYLYSKYCSSNLA